MLGIARPRKGCTRRLKRGSHSQVGIPTPSADNAHGHPLRGRHGGHRHGLRAQRPRLRAGHRSALGVHPRRRSRRPSVRRAPSARRPRLRLPCACRPPPASTPRRSPVRPTRLVVSLWTPSPRPSLVTLVSRSAAPRCEPHLRAANLLARPPRLASRVVRPSFPQTTHSTPKHACADRCRALR